MSLAMLLPHSICRTHRLCANPARASGGASLVEVLVAIVVLSLGLLGVAGLQASISKYKINTWVRASVATLVADMAERIRINPDAAGPHYDQPSGTTPSLYAISTDWATQQSADPSVSKDCDTTTCTSAERATFDLQAWSLLVRQSLPQGAALISGDRKEGIALTLLWFDKEFVDPGTQALLSTPVCSQDGSETGAAQQSCCPSVAQAPAGVRCARFSFVP